MVDVFTNLQFTLASGGGGASRFAQDLLVILFAAGLVSVFLKRLRLTSIPGYLLVGAIIGAFGLVSSGEGGGDDTVQQISDLAIVLLMFTIGMHLDVDSVREGMVHVVIVGVGSTIASTIVGWGVGMVFGLSAPASLAVSMGLAMSSTAVVLGMLQQRRELHAIHGRLCVGVSLVQDLLSVAVLALMPLIGEWAKGAQQVAADVGASTPGGADGLPRVLQLLSQGLLVLGGMGAMLAFGRYVLPRLLREAGRGGNTEAMLVVSAAAGFGAAAITTLLGFGPPLGAFLAGFLLSSTPFRHQLAGQLSPLRDLFMAVFFTAVGAKIDASQVFANWWIILIGVVLVMSLKTVLIGFASWAGGATGPIAGLTAVLMAQGGEFSLVVLNEATKGGVITAQVQSVVIAMVVVSLILAVPYADWGRSKIDRLARIRPARWIARSFLRGDTGASHPPHASVPPRKPAPAMAQGLTEGVTVSPAAPSDKQVEEPVERPLHVIIAGFGIVGRNLAEHFAAQNIEFSIVEMNAETVDKQRKLGRKATFGDISNPDVLESVGIHEADAIVLTIPDDEATIRACRAIRGIREDIFIAARTSFLSRAIAATEFGADHVTVEEVVTAQDMAVKVVQQLARRAVKMRTPHL